MLVPLIWVKSFWRVGEKGLSRTGEKRADVYGDVRSEVGEAELGFCLGSLPPRFSVTENQSKFYKCYQWKSLRTACSKT